FFGPMLMSGCVDLAAYDCVWIRMPTCVAPVYGFLRALRKENKQASVILEYGCFPYVQDLRHFWKLLDLLGAWAKPLLKDLADHVITYHGQKTVYGIPVIPLSHGVHLEEAEISPPKPSCSQGDFEMISIGSMEPWHALD